MSTGCYKDGRTVASIPFSGYNEGFTWSNYLLELRWSNVCKSNWTRVTAYNQLDLLTAKIYYNNDAGGWASKTRVQQDYASSVWSKMLYSPDHAHCVIGWGSGYAQGVGTSCI